MDVCLPAGESLSYAYLGISGYRHGVGPNKRSNVLVVCIHGLFAGGTRWEELMVHLAGRGYTTLAVNYPSEDMLVDAAAVQLEPIVRGASRGRSIVFVGHSLGGLVSRHLAPRFPGSHVVLVNVPNNGLKNIGVVPDKVLRWATGVNIRELEPGHFGAHHHPAPPPRRTAVLYSTMPCTPGCCCCCAPDDCCVPVQSQTAPRGVPTTNTGWVFHPFNSRTPFSMAVITDQLDAWFPGPSHPVEQNAVVVPPPLHSM